MLYINSCIDISCNQKTYTVCQASLKSTFLGCFLERCFKINFKDFEGIFYFKKEKVHMGNDLILVDSNSTQTGGKGDLIPWRIGGEGEEMGTTPMKKLAPKKAKSLTPRPPTTRIPEKIRGYPLLFCT